MRPPLIDEEAFQRYKSMTDEYWKQLRLPKGWEEMSLGDGPRAARKNGLTVLLTVGDCWEDGRRWLHVSAAQRRRMPSYAELVVVKRLFVGEERRAIQVFAPTSEHINIHPHALHLWACLDGDGLPDFGQYGTI